MTANNETIDITSSQVRQQLQGRQVLITGTTGFVGKVLLEKIMRSVPEVGGIHLLIRGNDKHRHARERFINEIACSSVFERLKLSDPDAFDRFCDEKVHCVTGEVTEPFLGLPREEFDALAENVDLIINSAASVDFREALDRALAINTLCLNNVAALAQAAGNVPVIQVSTCYVNGYNTGHMHEEVVRPAKGGVPRNEAGFYEVEELIHVLQDKIADVKARYSGDQLADKLIELGIREANRLGWNDTYTLTKWMGEQLLMQRMQGGTVTILRPSIVESTLREPVPGWIEGVKVADAIIMAYARQKVVFFPGRRQGVLDIIPADLVANGILLSAAESLMAPGRHRIYQCCSGSANPITLGELIDLVVTEAREGYRKYDRLFPRRPTLPFVAVDRHLFSLVSRGMRLPLGMLDRGLKMLGQEKELALLDTMDTTLRLATIFAFYTQPRYVFHNDKLMELAQRMGESDQAMFPVDNTAIDWTAYIREIHLTGLNRYALQERKLYRLRTDKGKRKVA